MTPAFGFDPAAGWRRYFLCFCPFAARAIIGGDRLTIRSSTAEIHNLVGGRFIWWSDGTHSGGR